MRTTDRPSTAPRTFPSDLTRTRPRRAVWNALFLGIALAGGAGALRGQEVKILSLSHHGLITWTNSTLNVTCRVEWASSVDGPWHSSWESLSDIVITNPVTERSVPMFYRVLCSTPPEPSVVNLTGAEALALVQSRSTDPGFAILDVRTPGEYATRHLKHAINLNFYATTFEADLDKLDRTKTYLVYCAAGSRSGQAVEVMRRLRFLDVRNLLGGLGAFAAQPGAAEFLEP
ncbi:MAG: rhodanese-like domain-containing protein [Verrucomicrobia bacterium]|nr:rhodanese-like domain-containing protein [Verrucomicrobiota bacterium]